MYYPLTCNSEGLAILQLLSNLGCFQVILALSQRPRRIKPWVKEGHENSLEFRATHNCLPVICS